MASSSPSLLLSSSMSSLLLVLLLLVHHPTPADSDSNSLKFAVSNGCDHDIWPAVQPDAGCPNLAGGGFQLNDKTNFVGCKRSIEVPDGKWSGRIWARTGCKGKGKKLKCKTGDCGKGLQCDPNQGGQPPFTLVQLSVHNDDGNDTSTYSVATEGKSNLPVAVKAKSKEEKCPEAKCDSSDCDPSKNACSCSKPQEIAITFCPEEKEVDDQFIYSS